MNTTPDELTLARWLDDELQGAELEQMEAWAADNPEQIEMRAELRRYRTTLQELIPASEEPPYPDFFLTRVRQGIKNLEKREEEASKKVAPAGIAILFRNWLMPLAACAGVMIAFVIGRQTANPTVAASTQEAAPVLYTPQEGVDATWVSAEQANASVIILEGVSSIPDTTDLSSTVYVPREREIDRTATREDDQSKDKHQNQ